MGNYKAKTQRINLNTQNIINIGNRFSKALAMLTPPFSALRPCEARGDWEKGILRLCGQCKLHAKDDRISGEQRVPSVEITEQFLMFNWASGLAPQGTCPSSGLTFLREVGVTASDRYPTWMATLGLPEVRVGYGVGRGLCLRRV